MENKKQNKVAQQAQAQVATPIKVVQEAQTPVTQAAPVTPVLQEAETPVTPVTPVLQEAETPVTPVLQEPTSIKNVKRHKTLGEYRKCVVHQTRHAQQNTNIFASIGLYTTEFLPGIEVSLPQAIITLLKEATTVQHYFDPNKRSENGNMGAHLGRGVAKYIVEMV